jgi:rubrerythrin
MGEKTTSNLKKAFQGESEAYFRNLAYAKVAEKEELPQIASLFRAMAEAEAVHSLKMLKLRGIVKDTEANLERAFSTENYALDQAYPDLIREAEEEGEKAALIAFSQARDVEEFHAALYQKAIGDMMADRESKYHVCTVCGYITDGEPPDRCPVCQAPKEKFKKVG